MRKLVATALLFALSTPAVARDRDVSRYLQDEDSVCTAYLFTAAHPQISLKSPSALWVILNMGPSDLVVEVRNGSFGAVFKPWDGEGTPLFAGDSRFRYTLTLASGGRDTKAYVCIPK